MIYVMLAPSVLMEPAYMALNPCNGCVLKGRRTGCGLAIGLGSTFERFLSSSVKPVRACQGLSGLSGLSSCQAVRAGLTGLDTLDTAYAWSLSRVLDTA